MKILCFIFLIFCIITCEAQGGWDIGYMHVDSINKSHVGKVVRVDFKTPGVYDKKEKLLSVCSKLMSNDTGAVKIDNIEYVVVERRKIYVDNGSYKDQYVECINCPSGIVNIKDLKILNVDENTITFQLIFETRTNDDIVSNETNFIKIDKGRLNGVFYKL